jgi:hypothetical protein
VGLALGMIAGAAISGSVSTDFKGLRRHFRVTGATSLCGLVAKARWTVASVRQRFIRPLNMELMKPIQMLKE